MFISAIVAQITKRFSEIERRIQTLEGITDAIKDKTILITSKGDE